MGVDPLFRRAFPTIVFLLLGTIACIQAYGIGRLVAATCLITPQMAAHLPRTPAARAPFAGEHVTSAAAILARNPFDSRAGELGAVTEAPGSGSSACDGASVLVIASSVDPAWSFAAIATPEGVTLRRIRDAIAGGIVSLVAWDRVTIERPSGPCEMRLGAPSAKAPKTEAPRPGAAPPAIALGIHRMGPHSFEIERTALSQILENPIALLKSVRLAAPAPGQSQGAAVTGVTPDSLLGLLGIENGDRLLDVNGFEMSDPKRALEAYARLVNAEHLLLRLDRKGIRTEMELHVR